MEAATGVASLCPPSDAGVYNDDCEYGKPSLWGFDSLREPDMATL